MSLNIEAGKWYRTRGGRMAFVAAKHSSSESIVPFIGCIEHQSYWVSWNSAGANGIADNDIIAELYEPRLRPWRSEEVPLGAAISLRSGVCDYGAASILSVHGNRVFFVGVTEVGEPGVTLRSLQELFKNWSHSTDGGKNWLPCGVLCLEGEK